MNANEIETHVYGTSKELTYKKWKNKFNNIIKQCKNWMQIFQRTCYLNREKQIAKKVYKNIMNSMKL